jgi:hypothetical protein
LQILAARALLFMVEGPEVHTQLAQDQQLRILAAALDSTHDPVSVMLQCVSHAPSDNMPDCIQFIVLCTVNRTALSLAVEFFKQF